MIRYSAKQAEIIRAEPKRWNILSGATRSGKTYVGYDLIPRRIAQLPDGNRLLIAKTERTLKRNIIDPMQTRFGRKYVSDISSGECKIFGKRFYCVGANDERAVQKLQGLGLVYAYGDEITTWPHRFFSMLQSRLSDPGAVFDGTCNPEGPYHWLMADVLNRDLDTLNHWQFTIYDNPFLTQEFVKSLEDEYRGSVWFERFILGKWVAAEGVVYDMFNEKRHVIDDQPASYQEYICAVDYGTTNPTAFVLLGIRPDGIDVVDEYYYDSGKTGVQKSDIQYADDLKAWLGMRKPRWIFIDPSAASFFVQLQHSGFRNIAQADNRVLDGLRVVGSLLSLDRLKIHKNCTSLISEITGYSWDKKSQKLGIDSPLKTNDHAVDALRYGIMGASTAWRKWVKA